MKSVWYKLVAISSLILCCSSLANDSEVDMGSWSFGVNVGLGQRGTFITGQDDVDIFVLPDVHYYGEKLFFDNGTLGYTLSETQEHAFSLVTELNPYGLYFEQSAFGESFNPLYLVSERIGSSAELFADESKLVTEMPIAHSDSNNAFDQSVRAENYNLPKPDINLDLGIQHNWFISKSQNITVKLVSDVTSKHSGLRGKFIWSFGHHFYPVRLRFNIGFDWLDSKSSNYYFALQPDQLEFENQQYKLGSSINPFISVTASMPITENISLVSHLKYIKFDSNIAHSPVTSKKSSMTHFAGIHYKFW